MLAQNSRSNKNICPLGLRVESTMEYNQPRASLQRKFYVTSICSRHSDIIRELPGQWTLFEAYGPGHLNYRDWVK